MADYNRQTARKCRIGHLLDGNHVEQEGWNPNYVETEVGQVSRANIMAIVVSKEEDSLIIDDGSGKIPLRSFGEVALERFDVGDKVLVIGRPRTYNEDLYLAAEIVKELDEDKWLEYRKKEIELMPRYEMEETEEEEKKEDVQVEVDKKIRKKIKDLDDGSGAEVEEVVKDVSSGEAILNKLMEEGEVFEIKPGKVKVLE